MTSSDLQHLIAQRLEDMAAQVEHLYQQGNFAEAELLREEGLQMADAYDSEQTFFFIKDLRHVQ